MPVLVLLSRSIALLPWNALRAAGAVLGFVAGSLLRIRRRHVEEAMRRAGLLHPARHAKAMYASLGTAVFEFLWMAGRRTPLGSLVMLGGRAKSALSRGRSDERTSRGMVVATAHTGNWDVVACAAAREHLPLAIVTKRLSSAWLDRFWQRERERQGVELLSGHGVFARAVDALGRGRSVAVLIDQVPERESAVSELRFLGRTARCDQMAALLAARTGCPLILALGHRRPDGTHWVDVPLSFDPPGKPSRAWIENTTRALTCELEHFVERHPAQWLWLHRRWKGRPPRRARRSPRNEAEWLGRFSFAKSRS